MLITFAICTTPRRIPFTGTSEKLWQDSFHQIPAHSECKSPVYNMVVPRACNAKKWPRKQTAACILYTKNEGRNEANSLLSDYRQHFSGGARLPFLARARAPYRRSTSALYVSLLFFKVAFFNPTLMMAFPEKSLPRENFVLSSSFR